MIDIEYIGHLKEELALEQEQLEWDSSITHVAALIDHLCEERGERWSTNLRQENLLVSVNQSMVKTDHPIGDDDQVIFFPPIAGG
jgi:molybdopterin converting factor small subunit